MFLKGSLTKLSAALLMLIQTPNLLSDVSYTAQVFAENSEKPISYLSLVAALGIIWGGIRRATGYSIPKLVIQRAEPVAMEPEFYKPDTFEIQQALQFYRQHKLNKPGKSTGLHGFPSPFEVDDANR